MDLNPSKYSNEKSANQLQNPYASTARGVSLTAGSIFTQSATSFTRGVIKWSFPKAKRFKEVDINTKNVPLLDLGSTLSKSATSLGFGNRYTFRPVETPGPGLTHRALPKMRSKNFSVSNANSQNRQSWDCHKEIPGPGSYEIERGFLSNSKGVILKSRGNILDPVKENPGPDYYSPVSLGVQRNRYSAIAFGSSKRYDFTKLGVQKNPGPGAYEIISPFERKTREFRLRDEHRKIRSNIEESGGNI